MADDKHPSVEGEPHANGGQEAQQPAVEGGNSGETTGEHPESSEGNGESLEKLEEKLKEMEEEQTKLAQQIEEVNEHKKLDTHLAVIEEQFRRSFDDRYAAPATRPGRPVSYISRFDTGAGSDIDLIKLNGIFRDISRDMGEDWKPVFSELTKNFPADVVAAELEKIELMQPIIRGYRSLNVWKELAGLEFNVRDLIEALRKTDNNDIAESIAATLEGTAETASKSKPVTRRKSDLSSRSRTAALDNRRMLLLAKKIGSDWEELGRTLGLPEDEITEIKEGPDSGTYQGAFKVLWAWRQTQPEIEQAASVEILKNALIQVNKQTLAEQLGSA